MEGKRINKYISETGICSRREADKLIENGAVTINGKRAEAGSKVLPGQIVKLHGQVVEGGFIPIIIVYNKPVGIVSTTDPEERDNIVNAISFDERIFPIGRLDKDSQGLILLTNEGDIVNKILRAGNNHEKEYIVTVDKPMDDAFIKDMQQGVPILGVVTRKCEIVKKGACTFSIILKQGLNRQIRRMCEYFGYNVVKLERIRIMHIQLGNLKQGQYRHLTAEETEILRKEISKSDKTAKASAPKSKPANTKPANPKKTTDSKSSFKGSASKSKPARTSSSRNNNRKNNRTRSSR